MDVIDPHEPGIFGVGNHEALACALVLRMRAGHVVGDWPQMACLGQVQSALFLGNNVFTQQQAAVFHAVDVLGHLAFTTATGALVHQDQLVLIGRNDCDGRAVIGCPALALADIEQDGVDTLLRTGTGVEVVGEYLLMGCGAIVNYDLAPTKMRVAKRGSHKENAAGDPEVGWNLAAGNHALEIGESRGEEGRLAWNDEKRAITQRICSGVKGHGDEFLGLEPFEGLAARRFEGLSESFGVTGLVGGKRVADEHGIGIAAAHRRIGEVDGETVASLGDDCLDHTARAEGMTGKMEDGLVDAVVRAIAKGPVRGAAGASQGPIEKLRAGFRSLHKRCPGKNLAHVLGQVEIDPVGLKVDDGIARSCSGQENLTFQGGGVSSTVSRQRDRTFLISSCGTPGSAHRHCASEAGPKRSLTRASASLVVVIEPSSCASSTAVSISWNRGPGG